MRGRKIINILLKSRCIGKCESISVFDTVIGVKQKPVDVIFSTEILLAAKKWVLLFEHLVYLDECGVRVPSRSE